MDKEKLKSQLLPIYLFLMTTEQLATNETFGSVWPV